jgi:hypothetical protein
MGYRSDTGQIQVALGGLAKKHIRKKVISPNATYFPQVIFNKK